MGDSTSKSGTSMDSEMLSGSNTGPLPPMEIVINNPKFKEALENHLNRFPSSYLVEDILLHRDAEDNIHCYAFRVGSKKSDICGKEKGKMEADEEEVEGLMKDSLKKTFHEMIDEGLAPNFLICCPICGRQIRWWTPPGREHSGFTEWEILQSERENFEEVTGNKAILTHERYLHLIGRLDELAAKKFSLHSRWTKVLAELISEVHDSIYVMSYSLNLNLWLLHVLYGTRDPDVHCEILAVFDKWVMCCADPRRALHLFVSLCLVLLLKRESVAEDAKVKCACIVIRLYRYNTDTSARLGALGALGLVVDLVEKTQCQRSMEVIINEIAFACLEVENHQMAEEAGVVNMALRFIAKGICVHDAAKILFNMRGNISAMNKVQQFGKVGELLKSIKIAEEEIMGPSSEMRKYGILYEFKQVLFHAYGEIFQIAKESREDKNFE